MASGRIHATSNFVAGVFLTTTTFLVFQDTNLTLAAATGSFAGLTITPDYDLNHSLPRSVITRIPYISILWLAMWKPYSLFFKHRSFWSHSPVFSTLIRIIYLMFWLTLFTELLGYLDMINWDMLDIFGIMWEYYDLTLMFLFCWVFQDVIHLWFDFVV